ncbi:hypothetical protein Q31a_16670 [Aureliella helgolandensis]|uniref:Uncharacterized protein n=1 Tax=Aureliella helgolandensis TaxID=2527968 RepID=A0A518G490_9BACT|nr:hypothetical protein Q31a_16670 [Aureliella helgolandensis]
MISVELEQACFRAAELYCVKTRVTQVHASCMYKLQFKFHTSQKWGIQFQ